jgi:type IV secretory pathway TrbD component
VTRTPAGDRVTPPPIPGTARAARPAPAASPGPPEPAAPPPSLPDKPPYLRFAFANPYNLALLGGSLAAAVLTLNPLIALAGFGLEAVWLVNHDNAVLRRLVWDPRFEKMKRDARLQERLQRLQLLGPADRARVEDLVARQADIRRLAAQNPSLTGDLLRNELKKTERLVEAFLDMAVTSARYDAYLQSVDLVGLDEDRARLERDVKLGKQGETSVDLARKNLAIILKRLEKMQEIRRYLEVARGQLDLIENSFQLIADQIVTMQSPQELSGQLNELLDSVESIRQTAVETDAILNTLGATA